MDKRTGSASCSPAGNRPGGCRASNIREVGRNPRRRLGIDPLFSTFQHRDHRGAGAAFSERWKATENGCSFQYSSAALRPSNGWRWRRRLTRSFTTVKTMC